MNTMPGGYAPPQLRASDADRDSVLAELAASFEAGRLTSEEFDERTSRALAARTMGELAALTVDLPSAQPPAPRPTAPPDYRPHQGRLQVIAIAAIVAVVLGAVTAHGSWHVWWLVLIPLIIARAARRRRGPEPFRRGSATAGGHSS